MFDFSTYIYTALIIDVRPLQVHSSTITYPRAHLLGIPKEIRDKIFELSISQTVKTSYTPLGARPVTGFPSLQLVSRQIWHETNKQWSYSSVELVPQRRLPEFIVRTLETRVLKSNVWQSIKSLCIEIPHNTPTDVFQGVSAVLRSSPQLEELRLFAVGIDGNGVNTSTVVHPCGKYDISLLAKPRKLLVEGQEYEHRLILVISLQWLRNLKVLVLDNLNLPLVEAMALKNKPHLRKLYISADPRTVMHGEYHSRNRNNGLGLGSLMFPVREAPPVQELRIDSNAIFTSSRIVANLSASLEILDWVIPDVLHQSHLTGGNFITQATQALYRLPVYAKKLRELRICVHNLVTEECVQTASVVGALKDCIAAMPTLRTIELHMHLDSPWLARELIESIPPSVTRLYLSDTFVMGQVRKLTDILREKTSPSAKRASEEMFIFDNRAGSVVGEDPRRQDFIPFSHSQLGFVGYEFDGSQEEQSGMPTDELYQFYMLNAKMLDKERNRHLAHLQGKHIPCQKGAIVETKSTEKCENVVEGPTEYQVRENRQQLEECGLGDDGYFGQEDDAYAIFNLEPVAPQRSSTYPAIVDVGDELKFSNHWLSK